MLVPPLVPVATSPTTSPAATAAAAAEAQPPSARGRFLAPVSSPTPGPCLFMLFKFKFSQKLCSLQTAQYVPVLHRHRARGRGSGRKLGLGHSRAVVSQLTPSPRGTRANTEQSWRWRERHDCSGDGEGLGGIRHETCPDRYCCGLYITKFKLHPDMRLYGTTRETV